MHAPAEAKAPLKGKQRLDKCIVQCSITFRSLSSVMPSSFLGNAKRSETLPMFHSTHNSAKRSTFVFFLIFLTFKLLHDSSDTAYPASPTSCEAEV